MDFSQLLNTSTDFDQNKLALLEKAINILYTTTNNQEVRKTSYLLHHLSYILLFISKYLLITSTDKFRGVVNKLCIPY